MGAAREPQRAAQRLLRTLEGPGLRSLRDLGLPQFSGMSFLIKVRMFLDPSRYAVLDLKLASLRREPVSTLFHDLAIYDPATTILLTRENEALYGRWCWLCVRIAGDWFPDQDLRAIDVERGVFRLVEQGRSALAAEILADAEAGAF